jgi:hypothetical protein
VEKIYLGIDPTIPSMVEIRQIFQTITGGRTNGYDELTGGFRVSFIAYLNMVHKFLNVYSSMII